MEDLANGREDGFRRFLELPNGIPSNETLSAVPGVGIQNGLRRGWQKRQQSLTGTT